MMNGHLNINVCIVPSNWSLWLPFKAL